MCVLVIGGERGRLGQELVAGIEGAVPVSLRDFPLWDRGNFFRYLHEYKPTTIINTSGFTDVDRAEEEPAMAYHLNATIPKWLAEYCITLCQCKLVHYSTDFVFSGEGGAPYDTNAFTEPVNIYGLSKLEGERSLIRYLQSRDIIIIRTSWLYGGSGGMTFIDKVLQNAKRGITTEVVADLYGSPTYTKDLMDMTKKLMAHPETFGKYHCTNSGHASKIEFAAEAVRLAGFDHSMVVTHRTGYRAFCKVPRPQYPILSLVKTVNTLQEIPRHWTEALGEYINSEWK